MFAPTYKYLVGSSSYSGDAPGSGSRAPSPSLLTGGSGGGGGEAAALPAPSGEKQKRRTPAWCDRILWLQVRAGRRRAEPRGAHLRRRLCVRGVGMCQPLRARFGARTAQLQPPAPTLRTPPRRPRLRRPLGRARRCTSWRTGVPS